MPPCRPANGHGACAAATNWRNRCTASLSPATSFSTLGLSAYAGRLFSDNDDSFSARSGCRSQLRGVAGRICRRSRRSSGSTIYIQAKPFTVIGIAPPGFFGDRVTDTPPDFWMPIHTEPYVEAGDAVLNESRVALALSAGPGAPGHEHRRAAGQADCRAAAVAFVASGPDAPMAARRSSPRCTLCLRPAAAASRICRSRRARA